VKADQVAQNTVHSSSEYLQGQRYHNLSGLFPVFDHTHRKELSFSLIGVSHVGTSTQWPLSFHSTTPRRVWFSSHLVAEDSNYNPSLPFSRLNKLSSFFTHPELQSSNHPGHPKNFCPKLIITFRLAYWNEYGYGLNERETAVELFQTSRSATAVTKPKLNARKDLKSKA